MFESSISNAFSERIYKPRIRLYSERIEKNVGEKGENAGNQHFLLFCPYCFLTNSYSSKETIVLP